MIDNLENNNLPSRYWFVHNWESEIFFPTQAEAIAHANSELKHCKDPDDGSWEVFVEDIYLGYVTHQVKPNADGYSLEPTIDNNRATATLLAALRYFQANRDDILDLGLPHFIDEDPLSSDEIDDLCKTICFGEVQL